MHTSPTTSPTPPPRRSPWIDALPWAAAAMVLACFLWLALGSYFVRAFSDCYNWLLYARDFPREFTRSRWPYGYPLFLRGAIAVAGPYWVFLANLPVMVALFAVVSWLGTMFPRDGGGGASPAFRPIPFSWAFLSVWVVVLAADVRSFPRYLNPYRDPLSYVLLMTSVGLFVRSLASPRPRLRAWGVAASGALLGLASSVREPSLLMVVPLCIHGILAWRAGLRSGDGSAVRIPFWGTVLPFAAGLALALVPFLVQTYLATHQVFLPPQASMESNVVPGSHFDAQTFRRVGGDAWRHYLRYEPWLLLLAAAGVVAAVRRRDRFALAVVFPAAAIYAVFYSFYWTFVLRYYYVSVLFLSLLAGYAIQSLLAHLAARWPRRGPAAGRLLLLLAACAASARLLAYRAGPDARLHQVPQARAMLSAFRAACPGADHIYAGRYLCEWLDWFGPCPSSPLPSYPTEEGNACHTLRALLGPRLDRGETLYFATWNGSRDGEPDACFLRRALDRVPAATIDADGLRAPDYARGLVWIYRIAPWTSRRTDLAWTVPAPGPHGSAYWYMLDAGDWPETAPGVPAAPATVAVDGVPLPDPVPRGGAWVGGVEPAPGGDADAAPAARAVVATVAADHPLPREMALLTGSLDTPLDIDFRLYSAFDHDWRWSGELMPRDERWHHGVRICSSATFELPVPCPSLAAVVLEWEVLSARNFPTVRVPFAIYEGDTLLVSTLLPGDRNVVRLVTPLPWDPSRASRTIRFEVEEQPDPVVPGDTPVRAELYKVRIHRWPAAYPVEIPVGSPSDAIHALSGFHNREGRGDAAYRWTSGPATIAVYPPAAAAPVTLSIAYSTESIPPGADPADGIRVSWDGAPLPGAATSPDGHDWLWTATLPPDGLDGHTPHKILLDAPTWRPADHGSRDSRTLGVRLHRVTLSE